MSSLTPDEMLRQIVPGGNWQYDGGEIEVWSPKPEEDDWEDLVPIDFLARQLLECRAALRGMLPDDDDGIVTRGIRHAELMGRRQEPVTRSIQAGMNMPFGAILDARACLPEHEKEVEDAQAE